MDEIRLTKLYSINLKRILNEMYFNQDDLAKFVNVSKRTINRYITGESMPDIVTAKMIADSLQHSLDEFFEEEE